MVRRIAGPALGHRRRAFSDEHVHDRAVTVRVVGVIAGRKAALEVAESSPGPLREVEVAPHERGSSLACRASSAFARPALAAYSLRLVHKVISAWFGASTQSAGTSSVAAVDQSLRTPGHAYFIAVGATTADAH